ncbi:MAG: hypothetical protein ACOC1F_10130, partial [Myxococcota bacterium]
MERSELLLVGTGFEPILGLLALEPVHVTHVTAPDHARAVWNECRPHAVVIRGGTSAVTHDLVRVVRSATGQQAVPIVVACIEGDESEPEALRQLGASDIIRLEAPFDQNVAQVRAWLQAGRLARDLEQQRAATNRCAVDLLQLKEELRTLHTELERVLDRGPLVMYSAEPV